MSETFTNWLTRLQNFTHAGNTQTRAPVMFVVIMVMIESITPTMSRERGGLSSPLILAVGRVWEKWVAARTEVEHRGGLLSTIAGSLPSGPRTAGRGTVAAAGRRLEPETGLRLRCWSSAQSNQRLSGRFLGSRGPAGTPACPDLRRRNKWRNTEILFGCQ